LSRSLVVDASVALKWVVTEPGSEEAASLLDELATGTLALLAPEHLVGEVANGLRKRVAQNVLTAKDAVRHSTRSRTSTSPSWAGQGGGSDASRLPSNGGSRPTTPCTYCWRGTSMPCS
jgi:hypothetical protein